jgi:hypothetical protein
MPCVRILVRGDSEDRVIFRIFSSEKLFGQSTLLLTQHGNFSYSPKQE